MKVLFVCMLTCISLFANDLQWEIESVEVREITSSLDLEALENRYKDRDITPSPDRPARPNRPGTSRPNSRPMQVVNDFLVVGEKLWSIVEYGAPITDISELNTIDVLPNVQGEGIVAADLSAWSLPRVRAYEYVAKNYLGMEVIKFRYRIFFSHSGTFDGSDAYISGLVFEPTYVSATWGFKLNVENDLVSVTNLGGEGLEYSKNVAANVQLRIRAQSPVSNIVHTRSYTITGDGQLFEYQ